MGKGWEELPLCHPSQDPRVGGDWEGVLGTAYHDLGHCFLLFLSSGQPGGDNRVTASILLRPGSRSPTVGLDEPLKQGS